MESETGIPHKEAANDMLQSAAPRGKCEDCETQPKQSFCQPPSHPFTPLVSGLFLFSLPVPLTTRAANPNKWRFVDLPVEGPEGRAVFETPDLATTFPWKEL